MRREFETVEHSQIAPDSFNVLRAPAGPEGRPINHLDSNQLRNFVDRYYQRQERKRQRYLARREMKDQGAVKP